MKFNRLFRAASLVLTVVLAALTLTGCVATDAASADAGTAAGGGISMILMMVMLIAVFYFFMIRPENKKKKKLQAMRDSLSVGDTITTIGGIMGKIVSVKDDSIVFETGEDRVRMQVTKWAVSSIGKQTEEQQ